MTEQTKTVEKTETTIEQANINTRPLTNVAVTLDPPQTIKQSTTETTTTEDDGA